MRCSQHADLAHLVLGRVNEVGGHEVGGEIAQGHQHEGPLEHPRVGHGEIGLVDGLTVDLGDWWFNLRPSNTEPLLRLNLEAPDRAACDARTAEVLALVRGT